MTDPLAGARHALLVATSVYEDSSLPRLNSPATGVAALAKVLGDPDVGGFEVGTVVNGTTHGIKLAIDKFLESRGRDDLTVLYLCGHGIRSQAGLLYLAGADTERAHPAATGVEAAWLRTMLDQCRAKQQLLILDCCYSGAFGLSSYEVELGAQFNGNTGRDRVVLASSTSVESSFELPGQPALLFTRPSRRHHDRSGRSQP